MHMNGQGIISDSIIYQEGSYLLTKSDAVLKILYEIGGFWKLFYAFIIIPKSIRNWFYDLAARNRYILFGKTENCMIPPRANNHRFLT